MAVMKSLIVAALLAVTCTPAIAYIDDITPVEARVVDCLDKFEAAHHAAVVQELNDLEHTKWKVMGQAWKKCHGDRITDDEVKHMESYRWMNFFGSPPK
jgi:hypothetical protein